MLSDDSSIDRARRQLSICNACRYCEGYCAVFPAVGKRARLTDGDITHIANLCHDCRACYQACMYAPPHEFGVDVPQILTRVRTETYRSLAWPARLGRLLERPVRAQVAFIATGVTLTAAAVGIVSGGTGFSASTGGSGSFYRVIPSTVMSIEFGVLALLSMAAIIGSFWQVWKRTAPDVSPAALPRAVARAVWTGVSLRFLRGGGPGCYYPESRVPALGRRRLHLFLVYGLLLDFVATVAAAIEQHLAGRLPPYPLLSVPVVSGIIGAAGVVIGGCGLWILKARASRERDLGERALEYAFLGALEFVVLTGVLLLSLRQTSLMAWLLVLHLGAVAGLYLVIPFSKFVHASHRAAALLVDAIEDL